jgi:predicted small secreted protein
MTSDLCIGLIIGAVIGIASGVVVMFYVLRRAISDEIGRMFGW